MHNLWEIGGAANPDFGGLDASGLYPMTRRRSLEDVFHDAIVDFLDVVRESAIDSVRVIVKENKALKPKPKVVDVEAEVIDVPKETHSDK